MRGLTDDRHVVAVQRPPRAAASDRHARRVRRRRALPRLAAAVGLHPTIRVHAPLVFDLVDTWIRPLARRLHLPRGAPRRPQLRRRSRSTPTRPRAAAWPASSRSATRRAAWSCRPPTPSRSSRSRSTCGVALNVVGVRMSSQPERVTAGADCSPLRPSRSSLSTRRPASSTASAASTSCATRDRRRCAPHWQRFVDCCASSLRADRGRSLRAPARSDRAADPRERRHLQRLRRPARAQRARGRSIRSRCIIAPPTGRAIEHGLRAARALLDAHPGRLYGPQRLLRDGLLPPALVFAPPAASCGRCTASAPAGACTCTSYAVDLARGRRRPLVGDGDRTQAPSGRATRWRTGSSSRALFPEAFRELPRAAARAFFRACSTLSSAARGAAPADGQPRIVLLTPGPYNETYFEHAYLARYLGLPLVEGGDLTVRDERVFLKTSTGSSRWTSSSAAWTTTSAIRSNCGPTPRSACRPGAGGARRQCRGGQRAGQRLARIAARCRASCRASRSALLGEELALPSLPTWWCGEAAAWQAVRGELATSIVLRPTFPRSGRRCTAAHRTRRPRCSSASRPTPMPTPARPPAAVARAAAAGATARCAARPAMVRVYAIADGGERLARAARRPDPRGHARAAVVSMQRGGTSLDTWVLTDGPVDTFSMLPQRLTRRRPGRAPRAGDQPHGREPVLARPLHRAHRAGGAPGARRARPDRRRRRRAARAAGAALSELCAVAAWCRPARRAPSARRTCSSAACSPRWPTAASARHGLQPATRWRAPAGALREQAVARAMGPGAAHGRRASHRTSQRARDARARAVAQVLPRCNGWRCNSPR